MSEERSADLLYADPPDRSCHSKPRRPVPPVPDAARGVKVGDIPNALLPPAPPPANELVLVGSVLGYEVHTRREVMERAERLKQNLGRDNWPSDALLATIVALRVGGHMSYREIAEALNMSERHVLRVAKRGKKEQVVERELQRLDREGFPMAVENVLEGLEAKDKEYTLEFLKGRGALNPKATPADGGAQAPNFAGLIVQFVHDGNAAPLRPGAIAAAPNRALAAGVIDVEKVGS